jgi:hypothetical protein
VVSVLKDVLAFLLDFPTKQPHKKRLETHAKEKTKQNRDYRDDGHRATTADERNPSPRLCVCCSENE